MADVNIKFLQGLNEAQREAVLHKDGPAIIIAGAGSGKTRVLTYRIANLIREGADPFQIIALTFTNKAAREMRERIEIITGPEAKNLAMGTFHSVFAKILRIEASKIGFPSHFTIYDTADSKSLLKTIIKEQGLNDKIYKPNLVQYRISSAKNSLMSPAEYQNDVNLTSEDESNGRPYLGKIYNIYWDRCFEAGAMDFDDLLFRMYLLLDQHPEVLYKYQHRFRHIMIDEYQDTNYAQYMITKKLAAVHENICVVGDDAQSIYSFRGADIQNIFNFRKDYPEHKVFKLEQNYRSTQNILHAANQVITGNKNQIEKSLWTSNDEGEKIKVVKTLSDNEEGRQVTDFIFEEKVRNHRKNRDFAILYRTNAQSRSFEESLRKSNIPYRIYGGMSFYQRKEIKDVIAYLRLTINHKDEEALRRVINYPKRGIGKSTIEKLSVVASNEARTLWDVMNDIHKYNIPARAANPIGNFITMIKSFATMLDKQNAYDIAMHVAKSSGLLKELYNDKSVEGISRYENIEELLNGIKEFTENDEVSPTGELPDEKTLSAFLQDVSLLTDADQDKDNMDTVSLMTIHAAKGLEFPCVCVVGMEENLFPSIMSMNSRHELEEERRLFYVAITRAKTRLLLSYATSRYRFGNLIYNEPSRFLEEIPEKYLDAPVNRHKKPGRSEGFSKMISKPISFNNKEEVHKPSENFIPDDPGKLQAGMQVEHQRFGFGKVLTIEGDAANKIATIFFNQLGQKKIMLKYAKLKIRSGSSAIED